MQQERRQQRHCDDVAPVENPVEAIERTVEREGKCPKEGYTQPEEVEGRRIAWPAQPHRRPDQQCEQPDRGEHVVHRAAAWRRGERHLERLTLAKPQQRVRQARPRASAMLILDDIGGHLHGRAVHCQQHVAGADARVRRRRARSDLGRCDAFGARRPEDAVFDVVITGPQGHVGHAERSEHGHHAQRTQRSRPTEPASLYRPEASRTDWRLIFEVTGRESGRRHIRSVRHAPRVGGLRGSVHQMRRHSDLSRSHTNAGGGEARAVPRTHAVLHALSR